MNNILNLVWLKRDFRISDHAPFFQASLNVSPVLAFYTLPNTLEDMMDYFVSRILDQANIDNRLIHRWSKND